MTEAVATQEAAPTTDPAIAAKMAAFRKEKEEARAKKEAEQAKAEDLRTDEQKKADAQDDADRTAGRDAAAAWIKSEAATLPLLKLMGRVLVDAPTINRIVPSGQDKEFFDAAFPGKTLSTEYRRHFAYAAIRVWNYGGLREEVAKLEAEFGG